jgi:type I restriction enzyme S subunit
VSLLKDFDEAIISQAYPVFEIVDTTLLLPEYLMMWFSRSEFDRQATFHAVGGVRGSLEWEDFLDFEIPIPSLETQQEIVDEYHTITKRIELNEQLNKKLEETAQALYKHWFVDFEFPFDFAQGKPDLKGKPYKSSGGVMIYNEELDGEIPEGWEALPLSDFGKVVTGKTPSFKNPEHFGDFMDFVTPTDFKNYCKFVNGSFRKISVEGVNFFQNKILPHNSVIVTCIGSDMGKVVLNKKDCLTNQQLNSIIPNSEFFSEYLYYSLQNNYEYLRNIATGSSTMLMINKSDFEKIEILKPDDKILEKFFLLINQVGDRVYNNSVQIQKCEEFKSLLLSKMATVGSEEEIVM